MPVQEQTNVGNFLQDVIRSRKGETRGVGTTYHSSKPIGIFEKHLSELNAKREFVSAILKLLSTLRAKEEPFSRRNDLVSLFGRPLVLNGSAIRLAGDLREELNRLDFSLNAGERNLSTLSEVARLRRTEAFAQTKQLCFPRAKPVVGGDARVENERVGLTQKIDSILEAAKSDLHNGNRAALFAIPERVERETGVSLRSLADLAWSRHPNASVTRARETLAELTSLIPFLSGISLGIADYSKFTEEQVRTRTFDPSSKSESWVPGPGTVIFSAVDLVAFVSLLRKLTPSLAKESAEALFGRLLSTTSEGSETLVQVVKELDALATTHKFSSSELITFVRQLKSMPLVSESEPIAKALESFLLKALVDVGDKAVPATTLLSEAGFLSALPLSARWENTLMMVTRRPFKGGGHYRPLGRAEEQLRVIELMLESEPSNTRLQGMFPEAHETVKRLSGLEHRVSGLITLDRLQRRFDPRNASNYLYEALDAITDFSVPEATVDLRNGLKLAEAFKNASDAAGHKATLGRIATSVIKSCEQWAWGTEDFIAVLSAFQGTEQLAPFISKLRRATIRLRSTAQARFRPVSLDYRVAISSEERLDEALRQLGLN